MSEIAKKENTELKATDPVTFGITPISKSKINPQAVALVNEFLPELDEKTKFFDRNNSQSTLSMMSLTMLMDTRHIECCDRFWQRQRKEKWH